jgi:spermidine dehydrogenase
MTIKITRRDLLNGMVIGAGGLVFNAYGSDSAQQRATTLKELTLGSTNPYYPPTLTGLRGSHKGSFEVAHALAWRGEKPTEYETLDQHYDLVIVGAGMSGLAAAWYYQQTMGPDVRILLLDNHDDFGGHAKRNEFHHEGRMVLGLGGAQNLESPGNYSEAAAGLMKGIGIDEEAIIQMEANTPDNLALGGKFHADVGMTIPTDDGHLTLGGHWLKFLHGRGNYQDAVRALPFATDEQDRLIAFFGGEHDYLNDLSLTEKYEYVNSVSYNRFLIDKVGLTEQSAQMIGVHLRILNGPSGWNHTVFEAIASGAPGLRAMGWLANLADSLGAVLVDNFAEAYMFPDGNASVARLLVQKLIPSVAPNMKGFEDVVAAQFDYAALDGALDKDQSARVRLNSTVVGVRESGGDRVEVDYVQKGVASRITAECCILACYNGLIPHLCPEMSDEQKAGLSYGVKIPFVYANVLLENGRAFSKLGVTFTQCPYDPFQWISAAPTMTIGGYEPPRDADDPMAVLMMNTPTPATEEKGTARDLFRMGRHKIYSTTFEQYEKDIREQLQALLGKHGFNHETDIKAITVNRIPHGYAYWYMGLDDPEWEEGQAPHEIGRAKFGRISIANSDSEATPLMDAAFNAAFRAVEEQT